MYIHNTYCISYRVQYMHMCSKMLPLVDEFVDAEEDIIFHATFIKQDKGTGEDTLYHFTREGCLKPHIYRFVVFSEGSWWALWREFSTLFKYIL